MVKPRHLLARWRHRRSCDGQVDNGRCDACRFDLVERVKDHERLLDPRY